MKLKAGLMLVLLVVNRAQSAEEIIDAIPRTRISDSAYETLRLALESCPFHVERRPIALKRNGDALQHLRDVPWPDLSKLERVHLYDLKDEKRFFNAWRLPGDREEMVIVTRWFRVEQVAKSNFSKVEVFDYAEELKELMRLARAAEAHEKGVFSTIAGDDSGRPWPLMGGIYHACAAAMLGKHEAAKVLVHHALKTGDYFAHIYDNWAGEGFIRGTKQLQAGASRTDVLSSWEESLKVYPHSRYREQLLDYLATLRDQIRQEKDLLTKVVDDPEKLSVEERIAYFIARFSDVHGVQDSQPGYCMTVGFGPPRKGSGTCLSDSVVAIGPPALPLLIEHLTDRRLTRSVGFRRNFEPNRTVLRVQDVALECIEKILGQTFYVRKSSLSYLSTESPEVREKVIKEIKAWSKLNGKN